MSPTDFIKEVWLWLISTGLKLQDIDEMDLFYYLDLMAYKAKKEPKPEDEPVLFINQVMP